MKIILIGYRGSGKTTVGKHLALRLNVPFIDTDHLIEHKAGKTISQIFTQEGELGFRQRETLALKEAMQLGDGVISTGGGVLLRPENRLIIRKADLIVYLTAPVHILAERTKNDTNRPPLTNLPHEEEIVVILKERIPLYEAAADITIDTSCHSIEEAANIIFQKVKKDNPCKDSLCF